MEEGNPIRRVVWGRRFLAATVVVPSSMSERLNTDALAVLAVIRNEARATGKRALPRSIDCSRKAYNLYTRVRPGKGYSHENRHPRIDIQEMHTEHRKLDSQAALPHPTRD